MIEGRKAWICTCSLENTNTETCSEPGCYPVPGCGTELCVEVRVLTLDELTARDKELAAANVEAGAVAMRERAALNAENFSMTGAHMADKIRGLDAPTPTLAALIAQERAAVAEEAAKLADACEMVNLAKAIRAIAERQEGVG